MISSHGTSPMARFSWWGLLFVCLVYGLFAFAMGGLELAHLLGLAGDVPSRGDSWIFLIHTLSGGLALLSGPIQFNSRVFRERRGLHRVSGRIYVGSVWTASLSALALTALFDVTFVSKLLLGILGLLWFGTTWVALAEIVKRRVAKHEEWMTRSFALTLFFVTFSFWVPVLQGTSLPPEVAYPLGVFLSWGLNLVGAEIWIRRIKVQRTKTEVRGGQPARALRLRSAH
jgi:hypothetical protein